MTTKTLTILILCFVAGAMIAHARSQARMNAEEPDANIVGWVMMDNVTKQLYFVERKP